MGTQTNGNRVRNGAAAMLVALGLTIGALQATAGSTSAAPLGHPHLIVGDSGGGSAVASRAPSIVFGAKALGLRPGMGFLKD
jgi:hypothetical protein